MGSECISRLQLEPQGIPKLEPKAINILARAAQMVTKMYQNVYECYPDPLPAAAPEDDARI